MSRQDFASACLQSLWPTPARCLRHVGAQGGGTGFPAAELLEQTWSLDRAPQAGPARRFETFSTSEMLETHLLPMCKQTAWAQ